MTNQNYIFSLIEQLGIAFTPLQRGLESSEKFSELLRAHGWEANPNTFNIADMQNLLGLSSDLTRLQTLLEQSVLTNNNTKPETYLEIFNILRNVIIKVRDLSKLSQSPPNNLPFPFNRQDFWSQFPMELMEELLTSYFEAYQPAIFAPLLLLGIIEEELVDVGTAVGRNNYMKRTLHWERLFRAVTNPNRVMKDVYGWGSGSGQFKFDVFLSRLRRFFLALGLLGDLHKPSQQLLDLYYDAANPIRTRIDELRVPIAGGSDDTGALFELAFYILPITPDDGSGSPDRSGLPIGIAVGPSVIGNLSSLDFGMLELKLGGGFNSDQGIRLEIRPEKITTHISDPAHLVDNKIDAEASLVYRPISPIIFFGTERSSRLQSTNLRIHLHVFGQINDPEVELEIGSEKLEFIIDTSDADSFVSKILGSAPEPIDFGGTILWSSKTGLHFGGHAGLKIRASVNKTLGVTKLDSLVFGITSSENRLDTLIGLTGNTRLGPLIVSLDNVGVKLTLKPAPQNKPGLLGDLDLEFGFKPPDGLGLAIDSDFANGGGYLYFDEAKKEYAGVLNLEVKGIALTAIGILTTRRPDDGEGFSLLIIISSEFQPIQLGFGFRLNGVGGLLGLNRTVAVDVLREGIKNRTLDSILFPPNPIENAPRIISDLKKVFPDAEGRFIFGPMAKISWGTPTLIIADVGLALEVPDPIRLVLLGKIRAALPKEDLALIQLNMDVLGVLDFEKSMLSIDATLYDSRLLLYTLSGDMALRVGWGAKPIFALSVGGLNPRFQPPPGFPTLSRLQVSLGVGNNPRLNLQAYLAITSNTVQFGALLELYAEAFGFNIKGHLGFDCLFQFDPFEFIADIRAGVAFRKGSRTLAAVNLQATLSGPRPWRARGKASISLLFIDVSVSFDQQWGDASKVRLPEIDVWDQLKSALEDPRNWNAVLPPESSRSVGYRNIDNDPQEVVVVDPFGSLTMRQKVAPLNRELTKFGNSAPSSGNSYFDIREVRAAGGNPLPTNKVYDLFAPAQFKEMTDDQKLSQPEFENMESGISMGAGSAKTSDKDTIKEAEMIFETYIIDLKGKREEHQKIKVSSSEAATLSQFGALKRSRWWNSGEDKYFPDVLEEAPAVVMEDEYFVIAGKGDLKRRDDILNGSVQLTRSEAYEIMNEYIRNHPEETEILQVMPAYEVMQAA